MVPARKRGIKKKTIILKHREEFQILSSVSRENFFPCRWYHCSNLRALPTACLFWPVRVQDVFVWPVCSFPIANSRLTVGDGKAFGYKLACQRFQNFAFPGIWQIILGGSSIKTNWKTVG
jgi:hypothetical protein